MGDLYEAVDMTKEAIHKYYEDKGRRDSTNDLKYVVD
jgi:hypothetical protein